MAVPEYEPRPTMGQPAAMFITIVILHKICEQRYNKNTLKLLK
jgi:hypothetical protein